LIGLTKSHCTPKIRTRKKDQPIDHNRDSRTWSAWRNWNQKLVGI
jgi:hypothetical protein